MSVSIFDAYKNKEYGWFAVYIFVIVVVVKIAGVIGVIGALLILTGLYETFKNSEYSSKKKFFISTLYICLGTAITVIVLMLASVVFTKIIANPSAEKILFSTENDYSLPEISMSNEILEKEPYKSIRNDFEISPPKGWVVDYSDQSMIVQFNDPATSSIGVITIASDAEMEDYSFKEYAAGVMQGFTEVSGDVKILSQGKAKINGEPVYLIEFEYTESIPNFGDLQMHAISASFLHNGFGYNLLGVTEADTWEEYKNRFTYAISTFHFLE